jgi:peptidoglycan/LPS O-acetylase OafA/YrhL
VSIASVASVSGAPHGRTAGNKSRLPNIDLLRFIAAVIVLLYHYVSSYILPQVDDRLFSGISLVTRYGYLGVDLFFMISGFVIVWSAQDRPASEFVISRFSRLYPTFWVAMLLTALVIVVLGPYVTDVNTTHIDLRTLAANATMMPQLFNAPRIDSVYWTLEFEIRFYFVVFLLVLFRQMHRLEYWLYAWLATCALSLFITPPWAMSYFLLIGFAPLFIAGGLFYVVFSKGWDHKRVISILLALALCMHGALQRRDGFLTPDAASEWAVPIITALFFLLFFAVIAHQRPWLSGNVAYRLGALTYPLYLTHAVIGRLVIGLLLEPLGPWLTFFVVTVLAFALAFLLVITVDEPARRPVARFSRKLLAHALSILPAARNDAERNRP